MDKSNYYRIYIITNKINGLSYIGKFTRTLDFGYGKYWGSGRLIILDIEKLGKENFTKETLAICSTRKQAIFLEKLYIDILGTCFPSGYNLKTFKRTKRAMQ